ncbi:MAG: sigma-54 dependent transcriptional regulator [Deferribacteraceae bacterium]|jgi:two-component system response regulator HydG|nr:sigma-54 dependent transcriptional regulator [Deferribacteraceae bacterium]
MHKILIVDDEDNHRHMLRLHLEDAGYTCNEAYNGVNAIAALQDSTYDIILLDVTMDVMDGLTFLSYIREEGNLTPAIIITANADAKTAVSAMKLGAADYITKPVDIAELLEIIKKHLASNTTPETFTTVDYKFNGVYSQEGMGKIIDLLKMVAPTDATVLILGESGTGKELVARSIHDNSTRSKKPFIAVNAASLNENLIESELFGYVKGAFTGANSARVGRFEEAEGGTLFLDEIGELPPTTQTKLLRFLQEKTFEPVGSSKSKVANVRIIAATHRDLEEMIAEHSFRQDLYFRLSVFPVYLPALRHRTVEIPLLVEHFVQKYRERFQKRIRAVSPKFIRTLQQYTFPGNVRELENLIERSIILARGDELTEDLLPEMMSVHKTSLKDNEKEVIESVLKECAGNRTKAAARLGISRRGLYNKLQEYGLV